jgi:redox-sensitive bicupin YhaK (pirin superfamily)
MSDVRKVIGIERSIPTIEGAGVRLKRVFGYSQVPRFDPFLLLDDFHSSNREDYIKGFPWHPHRGIETITYVLQGEVEHGDSLGNQGVISSGDVQWMTAGSGIVHQEMPRGLENGLNWGFQLWANLPKAKKMMEPRYRDITREQIPLVALDGGVKIKIICGEVNGIKGPALDIIIDPEYLDVSIPKNSGFTHTVRNDHTVFAYVIEGRGFFDADNTSPIGTENLVIYGDGDELVFSTENEGVRFLLVSGKPIGEPIAWGGPIVMNTQEELRIASEEYQRGTFLKHGKA